MKYLSASFCLNFVKFFSYSRTSSISAPVYFALPAFLSLPLPSLFFPDFQHPLSVLGPSVLALRPLLSLPSACLSPCLSDVKYHPFIHLHLIFFRPSPSPSYLPLISHTTDGSQVCPLNLVLASFLIFFLPCPAFCLSKRAFQRLSVIGVTSTSV